MSEHPTSEQRARELLRAAHALLSLQNDSRYVLNLLEQTVTYDGAECDGYCLMQDIETELDL